MWCLVGVLLWWSCQSPVAHSCGLLNHPNSSHGGMFQLNAKFNADSLLFYLLILNAMATQCTCLLNSIYCPHWLVQCSRSFFTHAHPGPLSLAARLHRCHTNHSLTLTMARLFLDRPCILCGHLLFASGCNLFWVKVSWHFHFILLLFIVNFI